MKSGLILGDGIQELNAFVPSNHRKMMLGFRSQEKQLWSDRFWVAFGQAFWLPYECVLDFGCNVLTDGSSSVSCTTLLLICALYTTWCIDGYFRGAGRTKVLSRKELNGCKLNWSGDNINACRISSILAENLLPKGGFIPGHCLGPQQDLF